MDDLIFPKDKVLDALRLNREKHIEIVRESQKGYREEVIKMLEGHLVDAKAGKEVPAHFSLTIPPVHVDDFDRAIAMLEMCTDTDLELSEAEFQCFVRGEWSWKRQFLMSNSAYSDTASVMLAQESPA